MAQRTEALPFVPLPVVDYPSPASTIAAPASAFPFQTKKPRAGPVSAGDLAGDHRQRSPSFAPPFEAVFENDHRVALAAPFTHQPRPGFQPRNTTPGEVAVLVHGLRQIGEAPPGGCANAAIGLLVCIQIVSERFKYAYVAADNGSGAFEAVVVRYQNMAPRYDPVAERSETHHDQKTCNRDRRLAPSFRQPCKDGLL